MSIIYMISAVLSLLLGFMAYYVSGSLAFLIVVSLLFLLATIFLIAPMIKESRRKSNLSHECYRFVNDFIITMSVTQSLEKSFLSATSNASGEFKAVLNSILHLDYMGRLEYLESYFEADLYSMFLTLFRLYTEQGGDILKISSDLLSESTRVEETRIALQKEAFRSFFQYALLWGMSLAILVFMRIAMANFFVYMAESFTYLASVGVYFLFLLVSSIVYCSFYTGEKVLRKGLFKKGVKGKNEKAKKPNRGAGA